MIDAAIIGDFLGPSDYGKIRLWGAVRWGDASSVAGTVWFVLYFASLVFIFPYLSVYYANKGLSSAQLGLIGSLRPWLSAVSSLGWSALADRYNIHRWVLVMNLSISTVTRLFLAFESSFGALLTTVLVSEFFGASVCVMVDAAVISACPQTSDYGKVRLWGAVGWGGFSSIAGLVIDRFGINAAFLIHGLLAVPCVFLGWGLLGQTPLGSSQPAPADISSSAETSRLVPGKLSSELDTTGNGRAERSGPVLGEKLSGLGPHTAASSLPPADGKFGRVDEVQSYAPHRTHVQHRPMRHTDTALELHTMSSPSGEESGLAHTQPLPNPLPLSPTGQEPHSHKAYRAQGGVDTSMHLAGPGAGVNDSATMHRRPDGNTGGLRHPGPACRGAAGEPPDGAHTQQRASLQLTHTGTTTRGTHTQAELHPQPGCLEKQQQQQQQRRQWLRHQQQQSVPCGEEEDSPLLQGAEGTQQGLSPTSRTDKEAPTLSFCEKLCLLGHNPRVWLFGAMSCLIGIGYGVIETWLFVYLQQLGGSRALMGVTLTVTCSLEIPFFYVQGYLLGKFKADTVMDMVLFAYVLRLSCYALLPWWGSPWAVLPVETLHGFTFAAAWGVGTVLAKQLAPEGLAATMQGLFQAMFMGVGYGLGALLTGLAAQYSPLQLVFAVSGAAMAVGWLVLRFGREVVARMEVGAAARDLDLELDDLLSVKETTITHQTIDVNTLNKTLKFLIKRSQNGSIHPAVQAKLDKLEAANAELRNQIAHLAEEQEAARKRLDEKLSTDQYEAPAAIQVLDQRISRLEEAGSKAAADGAKAAADGAKAAGVPSDSSRDRKLADDDDASKDGAAEVADQRLADDDDASKDGAAEVAAAAAAAEAPTAVVAASATVGAGAGGGGGDGGGAGGVTPEQLEAVHARLKLLETQATDLVSDANKLRGLVGSKADRSELDAAMLGGRPAGGGSRIAISTGSSSSTGGSSGGGRGDGGGVRDESVAEVAAGLDALRNVVGGLQERLRNKAEAAETEEHRERLAGIRKEINQINRTMVTLSVPAVARPVKKPVQNLAAAPSPTRIRTHGRSANDSDVEEDDIVADDEDDVIAARLEDLDSATEVSDIIPMLRELMERLDGKAEQARFDELHSRVDALGSGRLPVSANSPDLDGGGGSGMDTSELAMQLVALQGRMDELQHAMPFKADIDYVQAAVSEKTKADGVRMDVMEARVAKKADAAALDALRLQTALGAARAAVAGGGSGQDTSSPAGGAGEPILSAVREMMQDKATNAELEAVRSALAGKPGSVELEAVRGALSRKAGAQEVEALRGAVAALTASMAGPHGGPTRSGMASADNTTDGGPQAGMQALSDRMGDMYAELDALKDALNRSNSQAPFSHEAVSSTNADLHGIVQALHALSGDVKGLRDNLDMVAFATNILSAGLDMGRPTDDAIGDLNSSKQLVREARSPKGGYDRLVKRLGRGDYRHKMDAFDQDILARMAQKLTTLEVALTASGAPPNGTSVNHEPPILQLCFDAVSLPQAQKVTSLEVALTASGAPPNGTSAQKLTSLEVALTASGAPPNGTSVNHEPPILQLCFDVVSLPQAQKVTSLEVALTASGAPPNGTSCPKLTSLEVAPTASGAPPNGTSVTHEPPILQLCFDAVSLPQAQKLTSLEVALTASGAPPNGTSAQKPTTLEVAPTASGAPPNGTSVNHEPPILQLCFDAVSLPQAQKLTTLEVAPTASGAPPNGTSAQKLTTLEVALTASGAPPNGTSVNHEPPILQLCFDAVSLPQAQKLTTLEVAPTASGAPPNGTSVNHEPPILQLCFDAVSLPQAQKLTTLEVALTASGAPPNGTSVNHEPPILQLCFDAVSLPQAQKLTTLEVALTASGAPPNGTSVNHEPPILQLCFDAVSLPQAQKLTTLEVALRASGGAGRSTAVGGPVVDMGMKELEKQLRRATGDIRALKAQMGADGGHRLMEGDHAMLASKPLTGYRCLACDRPLEKLDEARGPHIPSQVMPNPNYPETPQRANRFTQQPAKESSNLSTPSTAGGLRKTTAYDPSLRGPQNWYEGAHGAPADQLPREDVGPKLPGGGWRGMENVAAPLLFPSPKGTLPELAPGTSGAVGSTATPGPRSPQVLSHGYRSSPARTDTASTGRTTTAASQHHGSDSATGNRNLPSIL
ncbi:MAG: hypothetical protein WDW36_005995 [Sanguina aurantia]